MEREIQPARGCAATAFRADAIVDAPEHYEYARGMGLLTWGTWDTEARPFEERLKDFLQAYPVVEPTRFQGSLLTRSARGEYGPADDGGRMARFSAEDNSFGTFAEILARYGLKLFGASAYAPRPVDVLSFRDTARLRNQRLRQLYGTVEVEAENMDEAKATELERLEKKHAAQQIRMARERMREAARTDEPQVD